jgi:hypothetical protein
VRRDLRFEFPRISHYFGIKPTDIDHMTLREIDAYRVAAAETEREVSSG